MGLLSKLFGLKKKEETIERTQDKTAYDNDIADRILAEAVNPTYDHKKYWEEKEKRIQNAIKNVPGSEQYYLSEQKTESNANILSITEFSPICKSRFVVFDLETSGLDISSGAEIVEIGAVRVENGQITEEYQTLVKPDYPISAEATAVNGITDDMLEGQPDILNVLPSFLVFVGDDVLAAHNVRFDYKFLAQACMVNKLKAPEKLFDSMALKRYYPDCPSKKLTALVDAAGIELETAHRALSDARMTAKLIVKTYENRKKKKQEN